jgi:hypothetical protein
MNSSTASPLLDFGFFSQKAQKNGVAATDESPAVP